jgi:polyferredoxin
VAYLGIAKSQLISITDLFRLVEWDFPTFKYSINWYLFAGFTLVSTILWGRLYCGRICAFGAFTQLMDATIPKRFRVEPPRWLERRAGYVKYGLLAAVMIYYVATRHTNVYRYVEPFWMFTGQANLALWIMLGVLLIATVVVRNLYCRFLCPLGAALGLISQVTTVFSIKRWSECKTCTICEKACEWGAIQGPTIIKSECVRCDDCEVIYDDKKACVHWLMIVKKERWAREGIKGTA